MPRLVIIGTALLLAATLAACDVFAPRTRENTATAEARTEDVFDQMLKTGNRKLLIARNGRLEGVISLSDLMTFLSIRSGLGLGPDDTRTGSHKTVAHV